MYFEIKFLRLKHDLKMHNTKKLVHSISNKEMILILYPGNQVLDVDIPLPKRVSECWGSCNYRCYGHPLQLFLRTSTISTLTDVDSKNLGFGNLGKAATCFLDERGDEGNLRTVNKYRGEYLRLITSTLERASHLPFQKKGMQVVIPWYGWLIYIFTLSVLNHYSLFVFETQIDGFPAIAKLARSKHGLIYYEQETGIYRWIDGTDICPQFIGSLDWRWAGSRVKCYNRRANVNDIEIRCYKLNNILAATCTSGSLKYQFS